MKACFKKKRNASMISFSFDEVPFVLILKSRHVNVTSTPATSPASMPRNRSRRVPTGSRSKRKNHPPTHDLPQRRRQKVNLVFRNAKKSSFGHAWSVTFLFPLISITIVVFVILCDSFSVIVVVVVVILMQAFGCGRCHRFQI